MTKVMRSKPAKHHSRLIGKTVIAKAKEPTYGYPDFRCGEYLDVFGSCFSMDGDFGTFIGKCKDWTVEEVIETEE